MTELPDLSGLPEGPWRLSIDISEVYDAHGTFICEVIQAKEPVARAIAAIPAMVEEIGRLRKEIVEQIEIDDIRQDGLDDDDKLILQLRNETVRLRSLNAEMREALKALLIQALQSTVNDAANEWGQEAIERARAILAKSESTNAS